MCIEEKRQPRRELIHIEARPNRRFHVGYAVAQREGDFLHRRRSRFAHVITRDRDRIPLRQVLIRPGKKVGDDAHRLLGRINIGSARDVLLQHVILHGAGELANVFILILALPPRHGHV